MEPIGSGIEHRPRDGEIVEPDGVHQDEVRACLRLLEPCAAVGRVKARFGSLSDGGYVMLDDFSGVHRALSLGIGDNVDWDLAMADLGLQVDQYDDSVSGPPRDHSLFRFQKRRIGTTRGAGSETLERAIGRGGPLVLKMDIEGSEWNALDITSPQALARCDQIILEFHDLRRLTERAFFDRARRVFGKLAETHALVHVHGNNHAAVFSIQGVILPDVLEATFASRNRFVMAASREVFPGPCDAANCSWRPDIVLGCFIF